MAAWLTWLKSRLLLPKEMEGSDEAEQAAGVLTDRLAELGRIRAVTAWLEARPRLGRDMFGRGRPEVAPGPMVAADFVSLFQACLDVLRGQNGTACRYIPAATPPPVDALSGHRADAGDPWQAAGGR